MRRLIFLLLIAGAACNSPMKTKEQLAQDSSQVNSSPGAATTPASSAAGGNANAGNPTQPGEEGSNVNKGPGNAVSKVMRYNNYKYTVVPKGDGTARSVIIAATDMKGDTTKSDSTVIYDVKGMLSESIVADLNHDKYPEVFFFTYSAGSEATGSVYGITYVRNKPVRIFSGDVDREDLKGYRGRDSFYIKAPYLMRQYPVYEKSDPDGQPGDGKRTIKYALEKEANVYKLKEVQ
ncbi:hypothetical protein [Chitinophaga tropicalis]|uniref:Lipoprotein n=1 Tax=Chitinophaga tropicalis TaxID=2683588 RepID=A0A7K1UD34_9BACT|nr:hypothetical protein [Chitinophaga tropicalis]MVT12188.1 hypothetical protein [Chitinophaga tropicalis]